MLLPPLAEGIDVVHHLLDKEIPALQSLGITKHVLFMWASCLVCWAIFIPMGRNFRQVPRGLQGFFEPVLLFIRDNVSRPNLGEEGDRFLPMLWSFFFFILFCNLLGLLPGGASATGNIAVTATLAIMAFCWYHAQGMREQGVLRYLRNIVPPGLPFWIVPLMIVIELFGHLAKPFALTVRLFANMTAGHVAILVLLGFIFMFPNPGVIGVTILGVSALFVLELFVAVLQAYVFTFLVGVFLGGAVHPHH